MPHSHQKKSTHFACKEKLDMFGDNAWCCACNNHDCKKEVEVECTCHDEVEVEMVELKGEDARKFIEGFMKRTDPARKCGCGLYWGHTGKHHPDEPIKNAEPHTMEEGAKRGCASCAHITETLGKKLEQKRMWLIWSIEHNSWWKSVRCGYTNIRKDAGHYTFEEAFQIVKDANRGANDEPNEAMVMTYQLS